MNIHFIYTGGTIGCVGQPLSPLLGHDFAHAFQQLLSPQLQQQYPDCQIRFSYPDTPLDSTNLQPTDWCWLAQQVLNHYHQSDAFIILHGTDTMAWSASALSFLLTGLNQAGQINAQLDKPVILTGSQLPLFQQQATALTLHAQTDALDNIHGAIQAAYSRRPEVTIYFHQQLLRGNRSLKTHTHDFQAFASPNYLPLNTYSPSTTPDPDLALSRPSCFAELQQQLTAISQNIHQHHVILFPAFPTFYNDQHNVLAQLLMQALTIPHLCGIVLMSYGTGNFPAGHPQHPEQGLLYQALQKAHEQQIIVVNCTQVYAGAVSADTYATGSWLSAVHTVNGGDLLALSAQTKLIWLSCLQSYYGHCWTQAQLGELLGRNLCGELTENPQ